MQNRLTGQSSVLALMRTCRHFREPCEEALYRVTDLVLQSGTDLSGSAYFYASPRKLLDCMESSARVHSIASLIPAWHLEMGPGASDATEQQTRAASLMRYFAPRNVTVFVNRGASAATMDVLLQQLDSRRFRRINIVGGLGKDDFGRSIQQLCSRASFTLEHLRLAIYTHSAQPLQSFPPNTTFPSLRVLECGRLGALDGRSLPSDVVARAPHLARLTLDIPNIQDPMTCVRQCLNSACEPLTSLTLEFTAFAHQEFRFDIDINLTRQPSWSTFTSPTSALPSRICYPRN